MHTGSIFSSYAEEKEKNHDVKKRTRLSQLSGFLRVLHKMAGTEAEFPILFHPEATTHSSSTVVIGPELKQHDFR